MIEDADTVDPVVLHRVECRVCDTWTPLDCLTRDEANRLADFMRLGAVRPDNVRVVPMQNAVYTKSSTRTPARPRYTVARTFTDSAPDTWNVYDTKDTAGGRFNGRSIAQCQYRIDAQDIANAMNAADRLEKE